ncbi:hypothetical protein AJ80_03199 [Polytolypa hystricis UAMH7299]|uniref:Xylanolytic transcriptional activator regulatory domain-containing protein n=1 Tax=Polytolypa hystricis (strain UAMH7299) TaxID=1447883 RepID=A0A2B7YKE4_POLH7|nr:hypothetical protein AJ80_03199 [Polytolypa hystricis UAMH7299]
MLTHGTRTPSVNGDAAAADDASSTRDWIPYPLPPSEDPEGERPRKQPRLEGPRAQAEISPIAVKTEPHPSSPPFQRRSEAPSNGAEPLDRDDRMDHGGRLDHDDMMPTVSDGGVTSGQVHASISRPPRDTEEGDLAGDSDGSVELGDATLSRNNRENGVYPNSSIAYKIKQAIYQRTDLSKPGGGAGAEEELKRLAHLRKDKPGMKIVAPDPKDLMLPSRKLADRLVAIYLTREYVNLPIFHLPAYQASYAALWTGQDVLDDPGVFRSILNAVFALGSLTTDPSNQDNATMYFIRAQNLLRGLDADSIAYVQAYLIAGQFLLAISNLEAAWRSVGLAIRVAQSLHLHLASGSQHLPRREDRELARRVWHSCMVLERSIAINQGSMPLTKHPFKAPLPTPLENEYVDVIFGGEPASQSDRPSIIEFFTATARLYERVEDVVALQDELRLTSGISPHKKLLSFDTQTLHDADRLLCNWQAALPPFLQPDANHEILKNPIALRQHNIIRIRYLHMRLLLFRPFLAILTSSPELWHQHQTLDTPLTFSLAYQSAIKCILAAIELIDILSRFHPETESNYVSPIPSWWENIGYVYACATVFLAARKCPASDVNELPESSVKEGWDRSIELLEEYRTFSPSANRCLRTLEELDEIFPYAEDGSTGSGSGSSLGWKAVNGRAGSTAEENYHDKKVDMSWLESLPVDLPEL